MQVSAVSLRQKLSELKRRHADKLGKSYKACSKGRRNPSLSKVASESAQATSSGYRAEGSSSPSATLSATSRLSPLELDEGTRVIEPKAGRPVQSCAAGFENRAKSCKADRSGLDHASGAQSSESSRDSVACNVGFEKSSPCEKNKFSGLCHSDLLIIEICAGTAVLSKCAKQHGFRTLPIDRSKIRSKGSDILVMDLANPCQASCVKEIVSTEASRILAIFLAPPCGTASRARERKLRHLESKGFKVPIPLRSVMCPDGLPHITGHDRAKVELANQLYDNLCDVIAHACSLDVLCLMENPERSLFWNTSWFVRLQQAFPGFFTTFDSCAHGGHRPKGTTIWSSKDVISSLSLRCDGMHPHKKWIPKISSKRLVFPTAEEAEYPALLCERIISCLEVFGFSLGLSLQDSLHKQKSDPLAPVERLSLGKQPKGNKLRPLVSEFQGYKLVFQPSQHSNFLEKFLEKLPKGSRVTSRRVGNWGSFQSAAQNNDTVYLGQVPDHRLACSCETTVEACYVGIPCEPHVFIKRAIQAGHPRCFAAHVDEKIRQAADLNFVQPPYVLAKMRIEFIRKWTARAAELQSQENELHKSLQPHLQIVLSGKRLLLWKEILLDLGFEDPAVIDDAIRGFKLSGWLPKSDLFPTRVKPPQYSVETLSMLAKGFKGLVESKLSKRVDSDLDSATWEETVHEVENGWLWVDPMQPPKCCYAMRFGLRQKEKIRVIDDCSICGLNATVGLKERFKLQTVDRVASMLIHVFEVASPDALSGIVGRTFDLKSAYRQFGICAQDRNMLRILVRDPISSSLCCLGLNALPFGAVGSVAAFLRIGLSIWHIGIVGLGIFWSNYFDDYPTFSRECLASSCQWAVESLLTLLGVSFAREGRKALPFGEKFGMLGLEVDLKQCSRRRLHIGHTESRREELRLFIDDIISANEINQKTIERLRGRMVFFECYAFGRSANRALSAITHACGSEYAVPLSAEMKFALHLLKTRLENSKPLIVEPALFDTWILFTDGACEASARTGGLGGVLLSPCGRCQEHFSERVPAVLMHSFLSVSENPIYELELLPILVSYRAWGQRMKGAQLVVYLDNDAARHSLIRGVAGTPNGSVILDRILQLEDALSLKVWYARVPTHSNIADGPSRGSCDEVQGLGSTRCQISASVLQP